MTKFLSLAMLLLFSTSCIKTADQVNRERRYDEQIRDSQGLVADMTTQVKQLRSQIDRLNGRLEELEHRQGQVNPENLKKMDENLTLIKTQQEAEASQLLQIQNELKEQRAFIEKVTASISEMKSAPAPKSSKKKSVKEELASGLLNIKNDKYAAARADLEPLIDHKDLTPGEQNKVIHGLGKVEYYTGNNEKALVYSSKIFTKYPKSSLAPSSLMFIGRSLKKMGKKDEAKEAFSQVIEDYPKSKEAADAKKNSSSKRYILGVETSCDDTSICVLEVDSGQSKILSLNSYNQDFLLMKWGGVVPELAARSHVKALPPLLEVGFKEAGISPDDITDVAVTTHPGLVGSLLTGINLAKTFAMIKKLPIIPVNHLYAHLEAIHLTEKISYPYLGLIVSGGHTAFWWVTGADQMEVIGNTLDDAAGEAFDKGGKLLGVGYPAGKIIDELAVNGDKKKYDFPISYMRDRPGKMSFSGLKTALRVKLQKMTPEEIKAELPHLCASYQEAIVQSLRVKAEEVIEKVLMRNLKTFDAPIVLGGGVACNSRLREVFKERFKSVHVVKPLFCTDIRWHGGQLGRTCAHLSVSFPECLSLDAQSRFVEKK